MITAAVSALLGIVGGAVPDVIKEMRESRDHAREREFLVLQHKLELERLERGASMRIEEAEAGVIAEEMRATSEHLTAVVESQFRPSGIPWIDGFNALLRPTCALMIIGLFMVTAVLYISGVMQAYGDGKIADTLDLAKVIWFSMIGESIQAVLGFLFAYRSVRKQAVNR